MAYTQAKLDTLLAELKQGKSECEEDVNDNDAYGIAEGIVQDEEGLTEFLKGKGITDAVGYIADRI